MVLGPAVVDLVRLGGSGSTSGHNGLKNSAYIRRYIAAKQKGFAALHSSKPLCLLVPER